MVRDEIHAALWTGADEAAWLGWLNFGAQAERSIGELRQLSDAVRETPLFAERGIALSAGARNAAAPAAAVREPSLVTWIGAHLAFPGPILRFGLLEAAQARGDFQVLAQRGRRALRVHLGTDVEAGLTALEAAVGRALACCRSHRNHRAVPRVFAACGRGFP